MQNAALTTYVLPRPSLAFSPSLYSPQEKFEFRFFMASSQSPSSLKALVVFRNYLYPALIRTVHVYQSEDGVEDKVEREYVFHKDSAYEETGLYRVLTLENFDLSLQYVGRVTGVWLCIYVFEADCSRTPHLDRIPTLLSISGNPKLSSIPTLANDLEIIFHLNSGMENREPSQISAEDSSGGTNHSGLQASSTQHVFPLDLNLPYPEPENEGSDESGSDLASYPDLPIVEDSKGLKVGFPVFEKKSRGFGIPHWPHRFLDSLIRDLQERVEQLQHVDEVAATLVVKRQRVIVNVKECIERAFYGNRNRGKEIQAICLQENAGNQKP